MDPRPSLTFKEILSTLKEEGVMVVDVDSLPPPTIIAESPIQEERAMTISSKEIFVGLKEHILNIRPGRLFTAIHRTCSKGHIETLKYLLTHIETDEDKIQVYHVCSGYEYPTEKAYEILMAHVRPSLPMKVIEDTFLEQVERCVSEINPMIKYTVKHIELYTGSAEPSISTDILKQALLKTVDERWNETRLMCYLIDTLSKMDDERVKQKDTVPIKYSRETLNEALKLAVSNNLHVSAKALIKRGADPKCVRRHWASNKMEKYLGF